MKFLFVFHLLLFAEICLCAEASNSKILKTIYENFKNYKSEMSDLEITQEKQTKKATFYFKRDSKELHFYLNFKAPEQLKGTKLWISIDQQAQRIWLQIKDGKKREIKSASQNTFNLLGNQFNLSDLDFKNISKDQLESQKLSRLEDSIVFDLTEKSKLYIDKNDFLPRKIEYSNQNETNRALIFEDLAKYNDIQLPNKITARDLATGKQSTFIFSNRFINLELSKELFE